MDDTDREIIGFVCGVLAAVAWLIFSIHAALGLEHKQSHEFWPHWKQETVTIVPGSKTYEANSNGLTGYTVTYKSWDGKQDLQSTVLENTNSLVAGEKIGNVWLNDHNQLLGGWNPYQDVPASPNSPGYSIPWLLLNIFGTIGIGLLAGFGSFILTLLDWGKLTRSHSDRKYQRQLEKAKREAQIKAITSQIEIEKKAVYDAAFQKALKEFEIPKEPYL